MRGILVPYGTRGIPLWPGHGPDGVKRLCGVDAPLRLKHRLEEVCRRREGMRGKNTGMGYGKRPAARDKKDASLCSAPFRGLAQGGGEGEAGFPPARRCYRQEGGGVVTWAFPRKGSPDISRTGSPTCTLSYSRGNRRKGFGAAQGPLPRFQVSFRTVHR